MVGSSWQMAVVRRIVIPKNQALFAAVVAIGKLGNVVGLQ